MGEPPWIFARRTTRRTKGLNTVQKYVGTYRADVCPFHARTLFTDNFLFCWAKHASWRSYLDYLSTLAHTRGDGPEALRSAALRHGSGCFSTFVQQFSEGCFRRDTGRWRRVERFHSRT